MHPWHIPFDAPIFAFSNLMTRQPLITTWMLIFHHLHNRTQLERSLIMTYIASDSSSNYEPKRIGRRLLISAIGVSAIILEYSVYIVAKFILNN